MCLFVRYKNLKLKRRVFLAGHTVAMITFCVTKTITTCSPIIGQLLTIMIVASPDKEWKKSPSKSTSWKLFPGTIYRRAV